MTRIWVAADHHFGHKNILNFTDSDGKRIRGSIFQNIREHDEAIVALHNWYVKPQDHVYLLGDVAITKRGIDMVKKMNGHKRLVRGNHDIFKTRVYIDAGFDEIYGCRVFQDRIVNHEHAPCILTHIPVHPNSLRKGHGGTWVNMHGHLHQNKVLLENGEPDIRYQCVSLEHTAYRPVLLLE